MASKEYRYKQTALLIGKLRVKAWHKPIKLIRKVGNLTCEDCFFHNIHKNQKINRCAAQVESKQLPSCVSTNNKRHYIFIKLIHNQK